MTSPRRLIVMRHAKSAWGRPALDDHARPLNGRGRRDAPHMGALLAERGWLPEHIFSSDSQRTRETVAGLTGAWDGPPPVRFEPDLYLGGVGALGASLLDADDALRTLMVLGHNPGMSDAVHALCGARVELKTAHAALLSGEVPRWSEALSAPRRWRLVQILRPGAD